MKPVRRSKDANAISSPTPKAISSMPSSTLPTSRTVTGTAGAGQNRQTLPMAAACLVSPSVRMPPASPWRLCWGQAQRRAAAHRKNGPSTSSSVPTQPKASKSCRDAGSQSEPWHGSIETDGSPKISSRQSHLQPHGASSHPFNSSCDGSQGVDTGRLISNQTLSRQSDN